MNPAEYKIRFVKLYQQYANAYLAYYVWRALQKKKDNRIFQKNDAFWVVVTSGLLDGGF